MKEVAVVGVDREEGDKSENPEGRPNSERGSGSGWVFPPVLLPSRWHIDMSMANANLILMLAGVDDRGWSRWHCLNERDMGRVGIVNECEMREGKTNYVATAPSNRESQSVDIHHTPL